MTSWLTRLVAVGGGHGVGDRVAWTVAVSVLLCVRATLAAPGARQGAATAEMESQTLGLYVYETGPTLFQRWPLILEVATAGSGIDSGTVSDLEVADFDNDGRNDVAVLWYLTDDDDPGRNQRMLSVFLGADSTSLIRVADIDLYIEDPYIPQRSVFRYGTAELAVGDFDGDGDIDLAATPFFGDEMWLIENLGGGQFDQFLVFPFDFNSTGNPITPPEALAADFDGDGRDELVYITDPIQRFDGRTIHFWKTNSTIASMHRVSWEGIDGGVLVQWTRGLAIADYDADGRPDLCFSGSVNPPYEDDPALVIWHNLDTQTGEFDVTLLWPPFLCSDVAAIPLVSRPGLLLADLDGTAVACYRNNGATGIDLELTSVVGGFAGYSTNFGAALAVADLNGDGHQDLALKQKLGQLSDKYQIELALGLHDGDYWMYVSPPPLWSSGLEGAPADNQILRPRAFAAADLFGNTLPEIVAGFDLAPLPDGNHLNPPSDSDGLVVACWPNSCVGDVTRDGCTDVADVMALLAAMSGTDNPDADLNKDGVYDLLDLNIILADYGCDVGGVDPLPVD